MALQTSENLITISVLCLNNKRCKHCLNCRKTLFEQSLVIKGIVSTTRLTNQFNARKEITGF